ncbi:hypothetical protein OY671_006140 [Metschnikowia pulcherrima]|nr:hypothetical protein OY671_006140 [Metschnikowia pulcherrima]
MQSASLPKSLRGDQSPVIAIDSPFPPLKTELRYRGVYERAGFDVNLGRNSDDRSLHSKKSPVSPVVSGKKSFFPKNVFAKTSKRGFSPNSPASPSTRSSNGSKENVFPFSEAQPVYTSHFNSSERNSGTSSPLASSQTSIRSSSGRPYIQQFQPEQKYSRAHKAIEQPAVGGFDRNKKQLKLFIPETESTLPTETSSDGLERESPFDREVASKHSTPSTSAGSSPFTSENTAIGTRLDSSPASVKTSELTQKPPYPVYNSTENTTHDLESSLADLKKERKAFDPRGTASNTSISRAKPATGAFIPAKGDLSESFNKIDLESSVGFPPDDSSFRFDSARHSADTNAPNSDYDEFLQTSQPKKQARNSQFSTVSSIISKQRKSSIRVDGSDGERDSEDDFDDEVALELQRQLDQIKTGSQSSLASNNFVHSEDSFVTANNVFLPQKASTIPTFKFSNETDDNSEESECETEEETELNETNDTSANEDAFSREIKPLSYHRRSSFYAGDSYPEPVSTPFSEPYTPQFKQTEFENDSICETPETIKPLSPKSHAVERELEDLNFKYSQQEESKDSISQTVVSDQSDIDILGRNPTPSEFDAFPKSVINPDFPSFRYSEGGGKAPPGTGPCRSCGTTLDPESKGSQKAIYSKSGDLSGQWHRCCFKCSYAGCTIQFNKQVTPYVLLDNAFCNHHYHTLNNTLCETCHMGIEGECIENELKQKWHLSCLKCTKCSGVISNDYFLVNHQIVCEADASSFIADLRNAGLTTSDKVEKRRTRMLFIE